MVVKLNHRISNKRLSGKGLQREDVDDIAPNNASSNTTGFSIKQTATNINPSNPSPNTLQPNLTIDNLPTNFITQKKNFTFNRKGVKK